MSVVVTGLLMTVLGFHFRDESIKELKTWKQTKTWLLIASVVYEVTIVIRYTFDEAAMGHKLLSFLIIGDNILQSYIFIFVCYYFV